MNIETVARFFVVMGMEFDSSRWRILFSAGSAELQHSIFISVWIVREFFRSPGSLAPFVSIPQESRKLGFHSRGIPDIPIPVQLSAAELSACLVHMHDGSRNDGLYGTWPRTEDDSSKIAPVGSLRQWQSHQSSGELLYTQILEIHSNRPSFIQ